MTNMLDFLQSLWGFTIDSNHIIESVICFAFTFGCVELGVRGLYKVFRLITGE